MFGLYQGIPMIDRSSSYTILPDRITIFAGPLSRACETREELEEEFHIGGLQAASFGDALGRGGDRLLAHLGGRLGRDGAHLRLARFPI